MRDGWNRRVYKIATFNGHDAPPLMKERRGWVRDVIGVYRADSLWRLDHLPSGYGFPGYFETRDNAMRAAECITGQVKGWSGPKRPSKRALAQGCRILETFADFHPPVRIL